MGPTEQVPDQGSGGESQTTARASGLQPSGCDETGGLGIATPQELALSDFTCLLCWARFSGPGDLAQHEQEEHEREYPLDYEPSTYAETK